MAWAQMQKGEIMETVILLLVETPDGHLKLADVGPDFDNKVLMGNMEDLLLVEMVGNRLLNEGVIVSYQLLQTVGSPITKNN